MDENNKIESVHFGAGGEHKFVQIDLDRLLYVQFTSNGCRYTVHLMDDGIDIRVDGRMLVCPTSSNAVSIKTEPF